MDVKDDISQIKMAIKALTETVTKSLVQNKVSLSFPVAIHKSSLMWFKSSNKLYFLLITGDEHSC